MVPYIRYHTPKMFATCRFHALQPHIPRSPGEVFSCLSGGTTLILHLPLLEDRLSPACLPGGTTLTLHLPLLEDCLSPACLPMPAVIRAAAAVWQAVAADPVLGVRYRPVCTRQLAVAQAVAADPVPGVRYHPDTHAPACGRAGRLGGRLHAIRV